MLDEVVKESSGEHVTALVASLLGAHNATDHGAIAGSWHFLGHASEIPTPGDYVRRTVAGKSVLLVRGSDGELRAFLNVCTHLGGIICRKERDHVE